MIAIVDFNQGDLNLIAASLMELNQEYRITQNEVEIASSDKIILGGTILLKDAVRQLHLLNLYSFLRLCRKPMLGIGIGMLIMSEGKTKENISCLGYFQNNIEKLDNVFNTEKNIIINKESKLLTGITSIDKFNFDTSYLISLNENTTSKVNYNNVDYTASFEHDNFYGTLFLPERSGAAGLKVINNFINL